MLDFHSKEIKLKVLSRFMKWIYKSIGELTILSFIYKIRNIDDLSIFLIA